MAVSLWAQTILDSRIFFAVLPVTPPPPTTKEAMCPLGEQTDSGSLTQRNMRQQVALDTLTDLASPKIKFHDKIITPIFTN